MKNRKWQRVLSWILTLTMLFGTFEGTGFRAFAVEDEVAAEETADDEATAVEEEADSEDTDVNDDAEASDEEEADDEAEAEEVEDAEEADEAEEAVEADEEEAEEEEADVTEEETDAPEEEEEVETDEEGANVYLRLKTKAAEQNLVTPNAGALGGAVVKRDVLLANNTNWYIADIDDITFKYGVAFSNVKIEAQDFFDKDNLADDALKYSSATWRLYKLQDLDNSGSKQNEVEAFNGIATAEKHVLYDYMSKAYNKDIDGRDAALTAVQNYIGYADTESDVALPAGLAIEKVDGTFMLTVDDDFGAPAEVSEDYYVLEVRDALDPTKNAAVYSNAFKISVVGADTNTITGASLVGFVGATADGWSAEADEIYDRVGTITFDAKKQGYKVASRADEPAPKGTPADKWVQPIVLTIDANKIGKLAGIDDLEYVLKDAAGNTLDDTKLEAVFDKTVSGNSVYGNKQITVKIAPKVGLKKTTKANQEFVAYLHVSSAKAFAKTKVIRLVFTLKPDVELKTRINNVLVPDYSLAREKGQYLTAAEREMAEAGKIYVQNAGTKTYVLATKADIFANGEGEWTQQLTADVYVESGHDINHPIKLGEFELGKDVEGIRFTSEGIGNRLEVLPYSDALPQTGEGNKTSLKALQDAGLNLADVEGRSDMFDLAGYFNLYREAKSLNAVTFALVATDETGDEDVRFFEIKPKALGVVVSVNRVVKVDGVLEDAEMKTMITGADVNVNKYSWEVASDITGDRLNEGNAIISIYNPSEHDIDVEITGALVNQTVGEMQISEPALIGGKYVVEIAPLSTGRFVLTPKTVVGNHVTTDITLTGNAIETTGIALDMVRSTVVAHMTTPGADGVVSAKAEIGKPYSFKFEASKDTDLSRIQWSVVSAAPEAAKVDGDEINFNENTDLTADQLSKIYGITLDKNTGVLTSDAVVYRYMNGNNRSMMTNTQDVSFWVIGSFTDKQNAAKYISKKVTLTVMKPDDPFTLSAGEKDDVRDFDNFANNKIDMGEIALTSGTGKTTPINIKNATSADLNNIDIMITKVEHYVDGVRIDSHTKDYTANPNTIKAENLFQIVFSENPVLQENAKKYGVNVEGGNKSTTFYLKSIPSTGKGEVGTELLAGEYRVTVRLEVNNRAGSEIDDPLYEKGADAAYDATYANKARNAEPSVFSNYKTTKPIEFTAILQVNDTPLIEARNEAKTLREMKVGDVIVTTGADNTVLGFKASLASNAGTQFLMDIADAPNAENSFVNDSGLTMDEDGRFKGTVAKAGVYDVIVTATSSTEGDDTMGTREFTIVILGETNADYIVKEVVENATDLVYKEGTDPFGGAYTWVLPGQIVGEDPVEAQFQIIKRNGTQITGKNVKITITDAEDDRIASEIAKNDANPYDGSAQYFTTNWVNGSNIEAGKLNSFKIIAANDPVAGHYKAKVTITGDNITTRYFYVYMVVIDKLSINQIEDAGAMVGVPYSRIINAVGAEESQSIYWDEFDPTQISDKDTLNSEGVVAKTDDDSIFKLTGLDLYLRAPAVKNVAANPAQDEMRAIKAPETNGVATELTGRSTYLGVASGEKANVELDGEDLVPKAAAVNVPTKADTFNVTVRAYAPAANLVKNNTNVAQDVNGIGKEYLNLNGTMPQQADVMTFTLVVAKSNQISKAKLFNRGVTDGELDANRNNVDIIGNNYSIDGGKYYDTGIQGELTNSDSEFSDYTGYVLKPDTIAYKTTYAQGAVTYTIDSLAQTDMTLDVKLQGSSDSSFKLDTVGTTANTNTGKTADINPALQDTQCKITIPAYTGAVDNDGNPVPKKAYITIVPKAGLTASENAYTDTVVISGENMEGEIALDVSLSVEDATYLTDAWYWGWLIDEKDRVEDNNNFTLVADDNAHVPDSVIKLRTQVVEPDATSAVKRTAMKNTVVVKNVGNSKINFMEVVECKEDGSYLGIGDRLLESNAKGKLDLYNSYLERGQEASPAATAAGIDRRESAYFRVMPRSIAETGIYTTYVKVSFKPFGQTEDSSIISYVLPVTYWVVDKDLDPKAVIEPSTDSLVLDTREEGYSSADARKTVIIRNTNEVLDKNAFCNVVVKVTGDFKLYSADASKGNDTQELTFAEVPAGTEVSFDVYAVEGLPKKTYTGNLSMTADNFVNSKTKDVEFEVTASDEYTVVIRDERAHTYKVDRGDLVLDTAELTPNIIDKGFAERLLNSFRGANAKHNSMILGITEKNTAYNGVGYDAATYIAPIQHAYIVALDLDGNKKTDVYIAIYDNNGFEDAVAYKYGTEKFALSEVSLVLTDEEKKEITKNDKIQNKTTEYFSTVKFDLSVDLVFTLRVGEVFEDGIKDLIGKSGVSFITGRRVIENQGDWTIITGNWNGVRVAEVGEIVITVPYGKTVGDVTGGYMPKATKTNEAFEKWVSKIDVNYPGLGQVNTVNVDTPIQLPTSVEVNWHEHKYSTSWDGDREIDGANGKIEVVKWTWEGDDATGYTNPSVTIYCINEDCPNREQSAKTFTGKNGVEYEKVEAVPATCVTGPSVEYRARLKYGTNVYTDKKAVENGEALGHDYVATLTWTEEKKQHEMTGKTEIVWIPSISLNCARCDESVEGHSVSANTINMTVSENIAPTCLEIGEKTYTVESCTDPDGNVITNFVVGTEKVKKSAVPAAGHQAFFNEDSVVVTPDFKTNPEHPTAQVVITCPIHGELFNGKVDLTVDPEDSAHYTSEVEFANGEKYIVNAYTHTEHNWEVEWSWEGSTSENAVAIATFTCTIGGEVKKISAESSDITKVVSGNMITYTATVVGPDKELYSDSRQFGESGEITHEHVWQLVGFDWKGTTTLNAVVKAEFKCSVSADNIETEIVDCSALAKIKTQNKRIVTWTVTVTDPDGKGSYTDKYSVDAKSGEEAGGDIEVGNGIFVSGLEEEYTFTGKAIKPAITVWDNDRGVQLAIGTDCTVSYKNNTKLTAGNNKGPAQILIKGKGNYAGKKAYVTFNIVDLDADIDRSEFVEVKKVAVSKDNFTYTGEALYPKTITVTYGNKQTIVLTRGDDPTVADYSGEGSDKVELVFQNNVNKGTANVAVYGSAAKPKAANYAIKAASISGVTGANELGGITWAVKAETPEANLSLGDYDLVLGQDYTMKVTAKTVGTATVKINGKGNFSGKLDASCEVTALELGEENIIVNAFSGKKVKVTVVDNAGNKVAGKFYSFTSEWEGNDLTVTVSATAKANGAIVFTDGEKTVNVGATKLPKMKKSSDYTFNGEALTFDSQEDLAKYVDTKGLELDKDFVIASYQNNNKKGTMKITIQGTGTYGGTQVVSVKIAPKEINNTKAQ